MKGLCRFLLLIGYMAAVLMVTTVEVKAYVSRADGEQPKEPVMANNEALVIDYVTVAAGEGQNTNEAENADADASAEEAESQETDAEDTNLPEDAGNPSYTESISVAEEGENPEDVGTAGESEDIEEPNIIDLFYKWRDVVMQFAINFDKRNETRTSYEITSEVNQADKKCIMENKYDFSKMKIACLGDSVTDASNLEEEEGYEQYAYPSVLKELLGAEEVYNLGIGGSSIGRYWLEPFVERYTEIPDDVDIIIVMGGYNDGFCVTGTEFGSLGERTYKTFCGDLDELMRGLKENYPDAVVFFATPLSNSLHGFLMSQNPELLPQDEYARVIGTLAEEYGFEFMDLYNSGILDSYDEDIVEEYIPDTVHGSPAGYQVLAEHFAAEIVKYYNVGAEEQSMVETENYESGISAVQ